MTPSGYDGFKLLARLDRHDDTVRNRLLHIMDQRHTCSCAGCGETLNAG